MSDVTSDIQGLERDIVNARELVERRQMALKLSENREFRKLFIEGYFKEDAARLVQLAGDPAMSKEQREDSLSMAIATGHAKRYLSMAVQMGAHAERELPTLEAALDELRASEKEDMNDSSGSKLQVLEPVEDENESDDEEGGLE